MSWEDLVYLPPKPTAQPPPLPEPPAEEPPDDQPPARERKRLSPLVFFLLLVGGGIPFLFIAAFVGAAGAATVAREALHADEKSFGTQAALLLIALMLAVAGLLASRAI